MKMTTVRIKATGQVLEMVPDVAAAMIQGGTAEQVRRVVPNAPIETMATTSGVQAAVTPQAAPGRKKPAPARHG